MPNLFVELCQILRGAMPNLLAWLCQISSREKLARVICGSMPRLVICRALSNLFVELCQIYWIPLYSWLSASGTCDRVSNECRWAPAFTGVACERSMCHCQIHKSCASALKLTCCCRVRVQDLTVAPLVASVDYVDGALNQAQVGVTPVGFGWMIKW